ncbi:MAG: zinc transporter ZupT [Spirochaetae bacterium HGW-Spirochaetae-8]|nr:MAG: zinc transporter ZupT [Spirochaetae bacterium HGW-Spirochaetae-8]
MDPKTIVLALLVTLLAGLSTGIGGLLSMFQKRSSSHFLSVSLGFSAGVMVYLSFMEILPEGLVYLQAHYPAPKAAIINIASFFMGIAVIALIDRFVPSRGNPHEIPDLKSLTESGCSDTDYCLLRTGVLSAIAIAIHNFPEGLATFTSYMADARIGVSIAIAIAIHNIPEGIAVAVPIYFSTGSRRKGFNIALLSGFAEMLGAVIGLLLFSFFPTDLMLGVVMASTAGVMVYISFDELLPTAEKYGEHHLAIYGVLGGMGVMAVSLLLLG